MGGRDFDCFRLVPSFSSGPGFQIQPNPNKSESRKCHFPAAVLLDLACSALLDRHRTPALPILFWDTAHIFVVHRLLLNGRVHPFVRFCISIYLFPSRAWRHLGRRRTRVLEPNWLFFSFSSLLSFGERASARPPIAGESRLPVGKVVAEPAPQPRHQY